VSKAVLADQLDLFEQELNPLEWVPLDLRYSFRCADDDCPTHDMLLCLLLTPKSSVMTSCGSPATEKGVTLAQIAKDFGVHEMTLSKWLRQAKVEDGEESGVTRSESVENRELRKRVRLLEQENEVLRRAAAYLSQASLPGKGSTRS
jgi:transposase